MAATERFLMSPTLAVARVGGGDRSLELKMPARVGRFHLRRLAEAVRAVGVVDLSAQNHAVCALRTRPGMQF